MNWTSTLVTGAGLWDQLDRYDDLNKYVQDEMAGLSDQAIEGSKFTPFGVAGYGGGAQVGADGSVNVNLDPAQLEQSQMLTGSANNFFANASADPAARENSIYDRIRAMQKPGEQRAMTDLESRAFAQGRLGMSASNYGGGSPEMLAMQTAIAENKNNAAFQSIDSARQQQAQDASLGMDFQNAAYLPQAQMLNLLNPGLQAANMNQAGQLGGMNLATQLGLGGVQSQVNSERIRGELMANLFSTVGGAMNNSGFDPIGSVIENVFSGLF